MNEGETCSYIGVDDNTLTILTVVIMVLSHIKHIIMTGIKHMRVYTEHNQPYDRYAELVKLTKGILKMFCIRSIVMKAH